MRTKVETPQPGGDADHIFDKNPHLAQHPVLMLFPPEFTSFSKRNKANIVAIQVAFGCVEDGNLSKLELGAELGNFGLCAAIMMRKRILLDWQVTDQKSFF